MLPFISAWIECDLRLCGNKKVNLTVSRNRWIHKPGGELIEQKKKETNLD